MRLLIFFDLPVETSKDRKEYTRFHKFLIKSGFIMMQKSVYSKLVINNVTSAAVKSKVAENLPPMPAKNKTNLAKTPLFSRFLSNSRLKYV